MEITVITRETIRPSSPTLHHLKHWKLSLFDQCSSQTFYGRFLLFYSEQGDAHRFRNTNMSDRLKTSLSEVLTEFYPLAGKFNSSQSVDCNDDGVEYIEARVKAPLTLDQLITCPEAAELDRLLPHDAYNYGIGFKGPSAVQVTVFDACGSMVIGFSSSHALADASTDALFLNSWAAIARRRDTATPPPPPIAAPLFNFASLFPPRDGVPPVLDIKHQVAARKLVTKRFVFPQLKIDTLRDSKFEYQRPTRVEAVSALILKCLANVSRLMSSKSVAACTVANLRTRMISPPLPARYLGNMILMLMIKHIGPEWSLNDLSMQLRKLAKEIDCDYLKKLQSNNASLLWEKMVQDMKIYTDNNVRIFSIASLCSFPPHGADFGWGVPTWASSGLWNNKDQILLQDAKNGDGIEAWVTLEDDDDDMTRFESQLLVFTGPDRNTCKL